MKIAAIVLAGGEGRRIGGGKPLRRLRGRPLLDHAVTQVRQWTDAVAVGVRDPDQIGGSSAEIVLDDPSLEGPLAGLAAGLRWARGRQSEGLLALPSDMPFLPSDLKDRLLEAIGAKAAAIASSDGRLHPVCGLWRVTALEQLQDYADSGRRSLRGLAQEVGFVAVDWPAEPLDPFFNINRPEDLDAAERLMRS